MVKEKPSAPVFHDGLVGGPAYDRFKNATTIGERTCRTLARSVDDVVRVARRIRQVIGVGAPVHPWSLEKTPIVIIGPERLGGVKKASLRVLQMIRRDRFRRHQRL